MPSSSAPAGAPADRAARPRRHRQQVPAEADRRGSRRRRAAAGARRRAVDAPSGSRWRCCWASGPDRALDIARPQLLPRQRHRAAVEPAAGPARPSPDLVAARWAWKPPRRTSNRAKAAFLPEHQHRRAGRPDRRAAASHLPACRRASTSRPVDEPADLRRRPAARQPRRQGRAVRPRRGAVQPDPGRRAQPGRRRVDALRSRCDNPDAAQQRARSRAARPGDLASNATRPASAATSKRSACASNCSSPNARRRAGGAAGRPAVQLIQALGGGYAAGRPSLIDQQAAAHARGDAPMSSQTLLTSRKTRPSIRGQAAAGRRTATKRTRAGACCCACSAWSCCSASRWAPVVLPRRPLVRGHRRRLRQRQRGADHPASAGHRGFDRRRRRRSSRPATCWCSSTRATPKWRWPSRGRSRRDRAQGARAVQQRQPAPGRCRRAAGGG